MSEPWEWTEAHQKRLEAVWPYDHWMVVKLRDALAEIDRLQQRCADSDAVNARYVKRMAELTDSAENWHRVADARTEELVKLQQRVDQLERSEDQLMGERDQAQEAADRLAYAIGSVEEIGEHSNLNCPWTNACELVEWKLKQLAVAEQRVAELERDAERYRTLKRLATMEEDAGYCGVSIRRWDEEGSGKATWVVWVGYYTPICDANNDGYPTIDAATDAAMAGESEE